MIMQSMSFMAGGSFAQLLETASVRSGIQQGRSKWDSDFEYGCMTAAAHAGYVRQAAGMAGWRAVSISAQLASEEIDGCAQGDGANGKQRQQQVEDLHECLTLKVNAAQSLKAVVERVNHADILHHLRHCRHRGNHA